MTMTSAASRAVPLKTYSRRVNSTTQEPSSKRRLSEDSQSIVKLPPAKKFARSSIQAYFHPLSSSPSPAQTRSSPLQSSDDLQPRSTPPSSPPQEAEIPPISSRRPQKRPKRRLSTKPKPPPIARMPPSAELSSSVCSQCIDGFVCNNHHTPYLASDKYIPNYVDGPPSPLSTGGLGSATSQPIACPPIAAKRVSAAGGQQLTQTQLNLGSRTTLIFCDDCGSLFDTTLSEDVELHKACRDDSYITAFYTLAIEETSYEVPRGSGRYKVVRYFKVAVSSPPGLRAFALRVLDTVNNELQYPSNAVFGSSQVFIAVIDKQPVAAVVVEAGGESRACIRTQPFGGPVPIHRYSSRVLMCVDRIWVHKSFRLGDFEGIHFGSYLLDLARKNYLFYTTDIPKSQVAFSAPTNSGMEFACKYFAGAFDLDFPGENVRLLVKLG